MTATQKKNIDKLGGVLNVVYKIGITGGVFSLVFMVGVYRQELKDLTFDTIDDKVNTKNHVNESLTQLEIHDLKNHIHNPDFHMPKSAKDSIYVSRAEWVEWIKNNAYDIYTAKRNTDKTLDLQKEQSKILDVIIYKLDKLEGKGK